VDSTDEIGVGKYAEKYRKKRKDWRGGMSAG
jgi:hypothetical protein